MDGYSGKRAIDGLIVSRKGSGRDSANNRDQNGQFCNRVGCSARQKATQISCSEKAKSSRPSFRCTSSGKEIAGTSRTFSSVNNPRKSFTESRRKVSSKLETDSSESRCVQEVSELSPSLRTVQGGSFPEPRDAMIGLSNTSAASNTRSRRCINNKSGPSLASKSTGQATRAKYAPRNVRGNSISDAVPFGCSTNLSTRKDVPKKRNCEGESSSSGSAIGKKSFSPSYKLSISDSRRARNCPSNIVGSRRSVNGARLSTQKNGNSSSSSSNAISVHAESSIDLNAPSQFSAEMPFDCLSSYSSSSGSLLSTRPRGAAVTCSLRDCNMDGIAEVLLALERIGQDEELTYEQLVVLETSLYDEHTEMRLDIDNMSYEELLDLEEKMGSVSTALTEEALSKCLERSTYTYAPDHDIVACVGDKDDIKCSICQEEYGIGDELGRLQCDHTYHMGCIHRWLRLKNWCPICKTAAAGPS